MDYSFIEEMFFIDIDPNGNVSIECNHCSNGEYMFAEGSKYGVRTGWLARGMQHYREQHTEYLLSLFGG